MKNCDYILPEGFYWIKGYENKYAINRLSTVLSFRYGYQREMKQSLQNRKDRGDMYFVVNLSSNGKSDTKYVHRLMAETFLPNPDNKPQINHKDGVKTNNTIDNLEWCTSSENTIHAYKTGLLVKLGVDLKAKASEYTFGVKPPNPNRCVLYKQGYFKQALKIFLEENFIPEEMSEMWITGKNILESWNFYLNLFELCEDKDLSLSAIAYLMKIDQSYVSYIRNNKRLIEPKKIYLSKGSDPKYRRHYTRIY